MLVGEWAKGRIEAADAGRGEAYWCPNCKKPLVLKKGHIKVHHFAHKPPFTCAWSSGETQAHLRAKVIMRDGFAQRGLQAELETVVLSSGGDRRADVLVWSKDGAQRAAIEIQHTPLDFSAISHRTEAYMRAGLPVVWVGLLSPKVWDVAETRGSGWVVKRYSVRPWERWAHTYGMGALWFLDPDTKKLWRGRLKEHRIEVPYSSFYDQYGNEESYGGYERTSRRWRELHLEGPYECADVGIKPFPRRAYRGKHYEVPGGQAAMLVPLAEGAQGVATRTTRPPVTA